MMKKIKLITFCLIILLALPACQGNRNRMPNLHSSIGMSNEIVVVMNLAEWDKPMGERLFKELTHPIPALPQSEPSMRVSKSSPEQFTSFMRYVRNILIVKIDAHLYTKVSKSIEKNKWANQQEVITLKAPSAELIEQYLSLHELEIVNHFNEIELQRRTKLYDKIHSTEVKNKLNQKFNIQLLVPQDMKKFVEKKDFFWMSNQANRGESDILVYSIPYTSQDQFKEEYLITLRDSVVHLIPGSFPQSHMTTEKRFMLQSKVIKVNKAYAVEMRGLWKMNGDKMGGPFVCRFVLDEPNQRILAVEGFIYAPESRKANYIKRIEASIRTLRLQGKGTKGTNLSTKKAG